MSIDDRDTALAVGGDVDSTSVGAADVTVEPAVVGTDAIVVVAGVVVAGLVVAGVVVAGVVDGVETVPLVAVDGVVGFAVVTEVFAALDEQLASIAVIVKTIAAPRNRV